MGTSDLITLGFDLEAPAPPPPPMPTSDVLYVGDQARLLFEFKVGGEFVVPSAATYTLRDNAGSTLQTAGITLDESTTETLVTIAPDFNTIGTGKVFENRSVDVAFTFGSQTYRLRQSYRVMPWLNYTCDITTIRSVMGLLDHELSEQDIDLPAAYFMVAERVTKVVLDNALAAGNLTTIYANTAIALSGAMNTIPSLRLRVAVAIKDDNQTFQRTADIDFDALADSLRDVYEDAVYSLVPLIDRKPEITLLAVKMTSPTDVITGV
jgi:hypothetical protein